MQKVIQFLKSLFTRVTQVVLAALLSLLMRMVANPLETLMSMEDPEYEPA